MLVELSLLVLGLGLLLGGGDSLVRGASALAGYLGVSSLIIGLTVVAFGTSAPELAVNVRASMLDQGEISFGNIMGSNIANIGLILGACAVTRPLEIRGTVISREIPMMLLATAAAVTMALDATLRQEAAESFDRSESIVLLLLFAVFLYYTVGDALRQRTQDGFFKDAVGFRKTQAAGEARHKGLFVSLALTLGGLGALIWGGEITVKYAVALAARLGINQAIVGLTLVALGTSLPELVTGVIAALRGQTELAVGNIVGSNIFNLLLVMGVTASIRPVPVPEGGHVDLVAVSCFSVLLLPIAITNQRRILRWEGIFFLLAYVTYCGLRVLPRFL